MRVLNVQNRTNFGSLSLADYIQSGTHSKVRRGSGADRYDVAAKHLSQLAEDGGQSCDAQRTLVSLARLALFVDDDEEKAHEARKSTACRGRKKLLV